MTLVPSIVMSPSVRVISRLTSFMAVVLPPPEGPISTQISPAGIRRLRSSTAGGAHPPAAPPRGDPRARVGGGGWRRPAVALGDVVEDDLRRVGPQTHCRTSLTMRQIYQSGPHARGACAAALQAVTSARRQA